MVKQRKDDKTTRRDPKIVLVDYGLAMKYTDSDGNHLPNRQMTSFQGNLIFASVDVLSFNRPSRKDDLLMLCYLLISLLNRNELPLIWETIGNDENSSVYEQLKNMREFK